MTVGEMINILEIVTDKEQLAIMAVRENGRYVMISDIKGITPYIMRGTDANGEPIFASLIHGDRVVNDNAE